MNVPSEIANEAGQFDVQKYMRLPKSQRRALMLARLKEIKVERSEKSEAERWKNIKKDFLKRAAIQAGQWDEEEQKFHREWV